MSMMPAVAGVSEPVRLAIPEANKDISSVSLRISATSYCAFQNHTNCEIQKPMNINFVFFAAVNHHPLGNRCLLEQV